LQQPLRVLYLHGFASSPASRKAQFFAQKLAERGIQLEIPDLAEHGFENLTISDQLHQIDRLLGNEGAILIGSSLGGYVAALYAARHSEVARLVLLTPAFNFYQLWQEELGPERLEVWKREGKIPVFHYGVNRELPLRYRFLQDAGRFEPYPEFHQPTLVFHGNHDASVPVQSSMLFAERHPNVRLIRLNSDHALTDSLETIWREAETFMLNVLAR
jgi:pimeloyl-ACP methyl ester carboxylesterase